MNVVYLLQSGDDGPVKIGTATDRGLTRTTTTLQRGNPEILRIRELLDGDERLERELHVRFTELYLRDDWYKPDVLDQIPPDTPRAEWDPGAEERQIAAKDLANLARRAP